MKVLVPLRTGTGQNDREHFRARARRVKHERLAVAWMLAVHKPPAGPVTVTLCRISPGNGLDAHDNLPASLKAPVDQVAEWLGRDDRDPSISWKYEQRRGKPGEWSVGIEVGATALEHCSQVLRIAPCGADSGHLSGVNPEGAMRNDARVRVHDINVREPGRPHQFCLRKEGEASRVEEVGHQSSVSSAKLAHKVAKP